MNMHQLKLLIFKLYKIEWIIALGIIVRVLFVFLMGDDHHRLATDSYWILDQADKALTGNFNFDDGRFIIAPFYPVFVAALKFVFQSYWEYVLSFIQITLSASSIYFIYKLAQEIFKDVRVSKLSALIFSCFPFSFWWINTYSTESFFQGVLIISVYFLVKSYLRKSVKYTVFSAVLFSVCFLTKSHLLMFSPFVVLFYFGNKGVGVFDKVKMSAIYGGICLLFTLPFGLYNLEVNDTYVLASNGAKYHFYTGNSEYGYRSVVDVPDQGTYDFEAITAMRFSHFHGSVHDEFLSMPQSTKQDAFFNFSLGWIKDNPIKFMKLKMTNAFFFVFPGVSYRHYPLFQWLFSFVLSFPIYVLAYWGIIKAFKRDKKRHFWIVGLFMSMFLFSVVWYVQNRFRTLTIEPFYFIYCSFALITFSDKRKGLSQRDLS